MTTGDVESELRKLYEQRRQQREDDLVRKVLEVRKLPGALRTPVALVERYGWTMREATDVLALVGICRDREAATAYRLSKTDQVVQDATRRLRSGDKFFSPEYLVSHYALTRIEAVQLRRALNSQGKLRKRWSNYYKHYVFVWA